MKKIIIILLFISQCQVSHAQVWTLTTNYPGNGGRVGCSFSIGDTLYSLGGGSNEVWAYDTLTTVWTQLANFPGQASGTEVGFSYNGKGYVATGVANGCYEDSTMWEYDPGTQTWTKLAHFPGTPRGYSTGFAIEGKLYLGGGLSTPLFSCSPVYTYHDFYEYDPVTNTWTQIADCPAKGCTQGAVGFSIGNKGYVGTGCEIDSNSNGSGILEKDFWEYDPGTNTWTQKADFAGGARNFAAGFAFCDKAYVGLGDTGVVQTTYVNDFWQYDPVKDKWIQTTNFPGTARAFPYKFVVGKTAFVGSGGDASSTYTDFYGFNIVYAPSFSADSSVCSGQKITFTDTSNYAPTNWYWQFPGGKPDTSTSQNPIVEYDTAGTYSVIFSAWNTCDSGTRTFTSYVTVGAGGVLTIVPSSDTICSGQSVSLVIKNDFGANFSWTPSTGLNDSTEDSVVANPTVTTIYSITGTGTGGCGFQGIDTITVNSALPFNILPLYTLFCSGQSATLYVNSGGSNFMWSPSSGLSADTGSFVVASPTVTTTYTVTGMNSYGCADTGTDIVTIIPSPNKPTFSQNGNVLTSSSQHDNQWYRNDTLLVGDTSQNLTISIPGEYWVVVNNEVNGCSTSSDSADVKLAGIEQISNISNQLSIYPTPFNNEIFIKINSSATGLSDWNLQVIDVLGRTVYSQLSLNYSNTIDLSNLPGGVYFITVINKTGRAVFPVVKQN